MDGLQFANWICDKGFLFIRVPFVKRSIRQLAKKKKFEGSKKRRHKWRGSSFFFKIKNGEGIGIMDS